MSSLGLTDQFQVFMRKIGWSVGLAYTFDRLMDLTSLYVREGEVSPTSWKALLGKKHWGLANAQIGDFFAALNVVRPSNTSVEILRGLDTLAILRATIADDVAFERAAKFVFAVLVVESDGEIFLNCLVNNFEEQRTAVALKRLIYFKRQQLFTIYRVPALQQAIARIVNIERQHSNRGNTGQSKALETLRRTEALTQRREPLTAKPSLEVEISDDYLRKVLPTRRGWAESMSLANTDGSFTEQGRRFIDTLKEAHWVTPDGDFIIWPMTHDILRLRLNKAQLGHHSIDYWIFVKTLALAFGAHSAPEGSIIQEEYCVSLLREQFTVYTSLNRPKALLRRELSLTIAYVTLAATYLAEGRPIEDFDKVIDMARRNPDHRIDLRTSQNSIGSLTFPKVKQ